VFEGAGVAAADVGVAGGEPVRGGVVLAICSVAAFMAFLDATIVNIAFPNIERSFRGVSPSWLSWIINGYNILFAALLLPAGRLADLVGRRRLFHVGLFVFTAASLLCAAAPTAELLISLRIVQAVGAALLVPTGLGLLLGVLPAERRVAGVAILGAAAAVAAAIGPSLGGFLVTASSWRLVFLVNGPLGIAALLAGSFILPEQRTAAKPPDLLATTLLIGSVGLVALAITQGPSWGWTSWRVLGSFALAAILAAALRIRRRAEEAAEPQALKARIVRTANAATAIFAAAFYAKILNDVLFLTSIWHYSILATGAAITPGPLFTALFAPPAGRAAKRLGLGPVAALGAFIYALGCGWYALRAGVHPNYVRDWLPGTVLTGLGIALAFPTLTTAAVESLPTSLYATGSALNATARQLGGVLGISVVIAIIGQGGISIFHSAYVHGWTFGVGAAAVAALAALLVGRSGTAQSGTDAAAPQHS